MGASDAGVATDSGKASPPAAWAALGVWPVERYVDAGRCAPTAPCDGKRLAGSSYDAGMPGVLDCEVGVHGDVGPGAHHREAAGGLDQAEHTKHLQTCVKVLNQDGVQVSHRGGTHSDERGLSEVSDRGG